MSKQQTSGHGRTTSCHKTGREDRTWCSPSLSSGFTTWPQWNARSFFQDHLWVICTTEAGIKTFPWFLNENCGYYYLNGLVHDWEDTGPPPTCTSRLWATWDIYEWDLLWHREAVLSGLGTFWKRSVSRSFLGVFSGCLVCCWLCCFLFVRLCCFVDT